MGNLHGDLLQTIYLPNGGDPENQNEASLQQPGMLGGRVINPSTSGNKEYQLVQVDSSTTNTPAGTVYDGATAWWSNRDRFLVGTAPGALGRGNVAGVFVNAATPGRYTCVQVVGRHDQVKLIDGVTASPTAAGLFIIPSATNGKADCLAAGSAATYPVLGRSASTLNLADSTCQVDLNVYENP